MEALWWLDKNDLVLWTKSQFPAQKEKRCHVFLLIRNDARKIGMLVIHFEMNRYGAGYHIFSNGGRFGHDTLI